MVLMFGAERKWTKEPRGSAGVSHVSAIDSRIAVNGFVCNAIDGLQRRARHRSGRLDKTQRRIRRRSKIRRRFPPGSEVHANETVRTGNRGRADLVFLDNTNLTVGPTSEVLLDKFVYDPMGSSGKVVLNATRGTFRFVTGTQAHRAYAIKTPYGTLGVRGTVAEMKVLPGMVRKVARPGECVVLVRLAEGAGVTFTTNAGVVHELTQVGMCGCLTADGHWVVQACPALFAEAPPPPPPPPPPGGGQSPNCVPQITPTAITCP